MHRPVAAPARGGRLARWATSQGPRARRPAGATTRRVLAPAKLHGRCRAAGRRRIAASRAARRGPRSGAARPPARPRCRRETSASRARPRASSAARCPTGRTSRGTVVRPEGGPAGPASFDSARVPRVDGIKTGIRCWVHRLHVSLKRPRRRMRASDNTNRPTARAGGPPASVGRRHTLPK